MVGSSYNAAFQMVLCAVFIGLHLNNPVFSNARIPIAGKCRSGCLSGMQFEVELMLGVFQANFCL